MSSPPRPSLPALIAVSAFGLLSLTGGWLIVFGGGFHASSGKHSTDPNFITGLPALFMASLQLLAAMLACSWVLRRRLSARASALTACGLVLLPPLLFSLLRRPEIWAL